MISPYDWHFKREFKMNAEEHLQKIAKARDAVFEARKNRLCTCSGYTLLYDRRCQCGSERPIVQAHNELWILLKAIQLEGEEKKEEDILSSPNPVG